MAILLLFGVFAILLILGVPVAFALAASAFATTAYLGLPALVTVIEIASGANSSTLIAIPLFILTGEIMLRGGLSDRIIAFAGSVVGHLRGGTMIPQMKQRGFDADFAVNVSITAALVALLVPPSHNLILYSAAAGGGVSIADLFAAGIVPALMLVTAVMSTTWFIARRRGYAVEVFPGMRMVLRRLVAALPGLMLIGIILGGIRAGIFTAVESASIAVIYALTVALIVYRQLRWPDFMHIVTGAVRTTGSILFVIAAAAAFGWLLAYLQVPAAAVAALKSVAESPTAVLLLIVAVLLVLGTFMDMAPMIIICTPIFLPVAKAYGISPVHFGTILILTAGIGLITPPVGSVLFVGAAIGKIKVGEALRTIWPFYLAAVTVLMLVTFVPALSLWLPAALR